ncbi:rod shape-determining protein RodA [Synechococcus sp. PCC 7336]|uniref:rod shape-determining protein RodA n=1 Tax=Synechococcus sp. PCC 7336 TaxID=195250 RepID=UPI0003481BEF|nr:rod shape-determining protein RodA [Synechococcus sp. PCC 7336]
MMSFLGSRHWLNWKQWRKDWKDFDGILLLTVMALNAIGILAIYSTRQDSSFWLQQAIMSCLCLVLALFVARIDYQIWLKWHWFVYGICVALLVAVIFVGVTGGGAARWINLVGFKVQPSEFAKLSVILTAAAVLHRWPIRYFSQIGLVALAIAPPWLLIFLQPDLGTALIFIAIAIGMLYWGGARFSWLLLLSSPAIAAIFYGIYANTEAKWMLWGWLGWVALVCVLAAWHLPWRRFGAFAFTVLNLLAGVLGQIAWGILKPYQRQRLLIFMDPSQDPLGAGYHLIQSRIAIGAGGLWGRGIAQGTQTQLDFIPEQHTDFIFAAIGEELGFIGAIAVLSLIWIVCFRLILIAQNAKDDFGALVAIGVFSMILFQSMVNIGMTIGLMPITGLPLPFVSYGRSALLTNYLALGIVESIAKHRQRSSFFT